MTITGSQHRETPLNHSCDQTDTICFGYRKVSVQEKAKLVLQHFNTVAPRYDFMNTLLSFGLHHQWKRTAVRMLKLKAGDKVIDVCGGTADLSLLAARIVGASGGVVLYDINSAMMAMSKPKVAASSLAERIMYVLGDAENLSFSDDCFDAAMVGFGIRNLTHMERGFKEMYRVLKPGGKLLCLEFSQPTFSLFKWLYDFYSFHIMPLAGKALAGSRQAYTYLPESIRMFASPQELTAMLREIGFSQVTYRKLTHGIAVVLTGEKS
jgi:demethylmenaquinone methyltransferase/2-methoxy-6-polyprenyl-1,4-benzoquinol methylase